MKRVIAIASGKGGVGKTTVSLNLSIALARQGLKVCLMDADMGLANVNVMLGAQPELNLWHMMREDKTLDDVLLEGPSGLSIIPGGSGVQELTSLDDMELKTLAVKFSPADSYDVLIVDSAAGIAPLNIAFMRAADAVFVIFTPEPTSVTDAYAVIKILAASQYEGKISLLPNMFKTPKGADKAAGKIIEVSKKALGLDLDCMSPILNDPAVSQAVIRQTPLLDHSPDSKTSQSILALGETLVESITEKSISSAVNFMFKATRFSNETKLLQMLERFQEKRGGVAKAKGKSEQQSAQPQKPASQQKTPPVIFNAPISTSGGGNSENMESALADIKSLHEAIQIMMKGQKNLGDSMGEITDVVRQLKDSMDNMESKLERISRQQTEEADKGF
jgi:flagellar biosynthesis protein FlhG